jgi:hypothetical protein
MWLEFLSFKSNQIKSAASLYCCLFSYVGFSATLKLVWYAQLAVFSSVN